MAGKMSYSSAALLLSLNLLCFSLVTSSQDDSCSCGSTKSPPPPPKKKFPPLPPPKTTPATPPKSTPTTPPKSPTTPPKSPTTPSSCPRDTLKLGVCADLLKSLLHLVVGTPPTSPCCSLIQGLTDTEAAVCLCTAIKANVLGINLNIPVSLSLLLNACGKKAPSGFKCT